MRNGFVRRYQRGFGVFVTPFEIERAVVSSTEQLLQGRPGIRVRPVYSGRRDGGGGADITLLAGAPHLGEVVEIQVTGGWCTPNLYVDGIRVSYDPEGGFTLNDYVNILQVEAVEVYRRSAEIPVEYGGVAAGCGVVVIWSKLGLAPGQRPQRASIPGAVGTGEFRGDEEIVVLPNVDETGPPPENGETIRLEISPELTPGLGLGSPWQGTFLRADEGSIVVMDPEVQRQRLLPRQAIGVIQVERLRDPSHAWKRATLWGGAAAAFTWGGLAFLCSWSDCAPGALNTILPSFAVGGLVFFAVRNQGPGTHWVSTSLPEVR